MNTPLSSAEETQRVAALASYNILDSLPEQEYDDITQLAAQICGTPIALLSLVDGERQWFKAEQGLSLQQIPRDQSFCAHNLTHSTEPLIVADARLDERFADNPLVTGQPNIVFYAGVPLTDPQGHTLGSLCVIDQHVRQLTPDQVGALTRLARQVMSLLALRKTNLALRNAQDGIVRQRLDIDFALQAVGLGVWELDPITNLVIWDERCRALFGIAQDNPLPYEEAIQYIHPDDVARVDQAVEWALNPLSDGQYDVTYRTIGADDGQLRWVRFIGKSYFHPDGQLDRFAGVAQNVTQQMQAHLVLRESEQRFRMLADALPQAIWVTDPAGNIEFMNKWWADYSGVSVNPDTAWQVANDSLHPDDAPRLMATFQQAIQQGKGFSIEQRNRAASGAYRWFLNVGEPYHDPQTGQLTKWVGMSIDIDDRKRAEQALQFSEARFRSIVEQAPMAIGQLKGRDMIVELGNERLFEVWGKDASVVGKALVDALPELEGQPFIELMEKVYDTGEPFYGTAVLAQLVRQGRLEDVYFDFSYSPIRTADEQITGILILAIEVTGQVLARQEIEKSERRFRSLVADAPFAIAVYETSDLLITLANEAMINLWGKTRAVIGQKLADALPELADQPFIPLLNVVYGTGETYRTAEQAVMLRINGKRQTRWFNFVYQPLLDSQGQVYAILNMAVDITDTYTARQQLQQSEQRYRDLASDLDNRVQERTKELLVANHDLQRSNDNLQQFAYVASHDLQEPLRKIQAFGSLLGQHLGERADEKTHDYLRRITNAGAHMSMLIRALLDYARITTRQQHFDPVSLAAVLANAIHSLSLTIEERQARIEVSELPIINGDTSQLGQLFQNLLSNALKFTPAHQQPQIRVTYYLRQLAELPPEVRPATSAPFYHQISVSDRGIGFDTKYMDRIFQVFQRLHGKHEFPGTGVGLAICQKIMENHGGSITADSKPGQGATFCVYFPA